jgi:hypothetical protein
VQEPIYALGSAPVPEGLESRVATGLQARAVTRQYDRSASHAWWRGAASGAAIATLAIGAVLLLQHHSQTGSVRTVSGINAAIPTVTSSTIHPASDETAANPCAEPSRPSLQLALTHTPSTEGGNHAEQPQPIADQPLTAEERALVLLARRTDPKELAILNPDMRAKLDAEEAAKFAEFFPPPPPAPAPLPTSDTQPN